MTPTAASCAVVGCLPRVGEFTPKPLAFGRVRFHGKPPDPDQICPECYRLSGLLGKSVDRGEYARCGLLIQSPHPCLDLRMR